MKITSSFRETVRARVQGDARFRAAMLTEAVNELLDGNFKVGKAMLCCAGMHECRALQGCSNAARDRKSDAAGRRTRRSGRDYVNATLTFERLAKQTGIPAKSLQRMLGPRGNPTAESLFAIIKALQETARIRLGVTTKRAA